VLSVSPGILKEEQKVEIKALLLSNDPEAKVMLHRVHYVRKDV
jgi:hypothetical protein